MNTTTYHLPFCYHVPFDLCNASEMLRLIRALKSFISHSEYELVYRPKRKCLIIHDYSGNFETYVFETGQAYLTTISNAIFIFNDHLLIDRRILLSFYVKTKFPFEDPYEEPEPEEIPTDFQRESFLRDNTLKTGRFSGRGFKVLEPTKTDVKFLKHTDTVNPKKKTYNTNCIHLYPDKTIFRKYEEI